MRGAHAKEILALVAAHDRLAKLKGITVLFGWCLSEATIPYFPFIEAFEAYFASFGQDHQSIGPPQFAQLDFGEVSQVEERGITSLLLGSQPFNKSGKPERRSPGSPRPPRRKGGRSMLNRHEHNPFVQAAKGFSYILPEKLMEKRSTWKSY